MITPGQGVAMTAIIQVVPGVFLGPACTVCRYPDRAISQNTFGLTY